jgi:hypothetical protein
MTKPSPPNTGTPPIAGTEPDWLRDPAYELVGFVPCVPFEGPDGAVEEGMLKKGARRMTGVSLTLLDDETLVVEAPDVGHRQVYPKGLASLLFQRRRTTEPGP